MFLYIFSRLYVQHCSAKYNLAVTRPMFVPPLIRAHLFRNWVENRLDVVANSDFKCVLRVFVDVRQAVFGSNATLHANVFESVAGEVGRSSCVATRRRDDECTSLKRVQACSVRLSP